MIPLDILSDPICPWCMIGKANLDRALAEAGHNPFAIRWRAFRLNPDMPPGGMDRRAYLRAKFGREDGAQAYARVREAARAAGVEMNLDAIARVPDTTDAHRLIRWAHGAGVQAAVVQALFDAYFREGRDIGDHAELAAIAGAAGMDAGMVARLLAGDADREAVIAEDSQARALGIGGVPTFILAGRHVVQGARPAGDWRRIIAELAALPG
ncbi:MAG: DsbA family oxidoreductase [Alphaproteobacteria bacterium]|nr:MAG: DsbA family oxidoreductase [Alphaproteobacteria bacterium]